MPFTSPTHREAAEAISSAIDAAEHIVAIGHRYADPDAIGSLLALTLALESAGKQFTPCLPTKVGGLPATLPDIGKVHIGEVPGDASPDLVIVLDSSDLSRIAPLNAKHPHLFDGSLPLINIDHHKNDEFGAINLVDRTSVATAGILYRLLQTLEMPVTPGVAQYLLMGILGDTQVFTTLATDAASLAMASELIEAGASMPDAVRVVSGLELARVRYWAGVMSRTTLYANGRLALMTTSQTEQQAAPVHDPSEGLADFLIRVYDVDVICLLVERPGGEIKGSLRTPSKALDMGAIAKQLGGGGHKVRGGFSQYDQPMQKVKDKVLATIMQCLDQQERGV